MFGEQGAKPPEVPITMGAPKVERGHPPPVDVCRWPRRSPGAGNARALPPREEGRKQWMENAKPILGGVALEEMVCRGL